MIQEFVDKFMASTNDLKVYFKENTPAHYEDIVKAVVNILNDVDEYESPDPERIHEIDDGDYQGTLLYLIAANSYQPSKYWFVKVNYGSCSGCDTLQDIQSSGNFGEPQIEDYMTLALHIVQGLKELPE